METRILHSTAERTLQSPAEVPKARIALLALGAAALVAGVCGGLGRLGVPVTFGEAAANHGALMTGGFLGTVVSLERAIALGKPFGYGAPVAAGLGAVLLVVGRREAGLIVELAAPLFLLAIGIALLRRQRPAHVALLLLASGAWAIGNGLSLAGAMPDAPAAWWFAFLVLTIAAERFEMTRLVRRSPIAARLLHAAVALVLAGAAFETLFPNSGAIAFGAGLVGIAAWGAAFDLARRTIRTGGFSRYAAVAVLAGYAWLAIGGFAWAMMSVDPAWRDAAMHALGLGFVASMILAHAPVVVSAIAKRRMRCTPLFYAPLVLLYASLVLRLIGGPSAITLRQAGGIGNALALALFVGTLAYALNRTTATGDRKQTPNDRR